jgi:putative FmdB family regulatory protein
MPIFEYECQECKHKFEQLVLPRDLKNENFKIQCPHEHEHQLGKDYEIRKLISQHAQHLSWSKWRAID